MIAVVMEKKPIDKEALLHLSKLSRIEISSPEQEAKLLRDAENILSRFEELKQVNTDGVASISGGGEIENRTRLDETSSELTGRGYASFPEMKGGYLVVPPVREKESDL